VNTAIQLRIGIDKAILAGDDPVLDEAVDEAARRGHRGRTLQLWSGNQRDRPDETGRTGVMVAP